MRILYLGRGSPGLGPFSIDQHLVLFLLQLMIKQVHHTCNCCCFIQGKPVSATNAPTLQTVASFSIFLKRRNLSLICERRLFIDFMERSDKFSKSVKNIAKYCPP